MSLSTLNSKFNSDVDTKIEHLIFGYVRNSTENVRNTIVPKSILLIIIKFFYSTRSRIAYVKSNKSYFSTFPPTIYIGELKYDNKHYNTFHLQLLTEEPVKHAFDSNSGVCFVSDFQLPSYVFKSNTNLNKDNSYDVVFTSQFANKHNTAYIIDTTDKQNDNYNIYGWKLPLFTTCACGQYLLYSNKYGLISVGDGYDDRTGTNDLTILNFNEISDDLKSFKWKDTKWKWTEGEHGRPNLSAAFINDDKMICVGGGGIYVKFVDIYDFKTNKMTKLSEMNEQRGCCGICVDEFIGNKVYVAGGYRSESTFEYYDINKDKWVKLADTVGQHDRWPLIWNEQPNIIIIAGASDRKGFESIDIRENKWNDYVLYDNKNVDDLFGTDVTFGYETRLLMG
eukprot:278489_1